MTWNVGAQLSAPPIRSLRPYARVEVIGVGPYRYDAKELENQSHFIRTNLRVGVAGENWRLEAFINNVFGAHYVPLSDFRIAQPGDPPTAGMTLALSF